MLKNKIAFTLIEVVIATSIITITVFWVYKLIWENIKIINNSSNTYQSKTIFPLLEECIENIWFNTFNSLEYNFNFWINNLWCSTWIGNDVIIDNIDYQLSWIITNSWSNFIDWELSINSDQTKTLTWFYKQIKK